MARKIWKLNKFDKGINSFTNPKDISDSEWATLEDVDVSKVGIAKSLGVPTEDTSVIPKEVEELIPGKGLYRFSTDTAFMPENSDSSWSSTALVQLPGANAVKASATFGIKSLVWLFDAKPTNATIKFQLKVDGTAIMSEMTVLAGNLSSTVLDNDGTSSNKLDLTSFVSGGDVSSLFWEEESAGAKYTFIPHQAVRYNPIDTWDSANMSDTAASHFDCTVPNLDGGFWESRQQMDNLQDPAYWWEANLNNENLPFSATFASASPPLTPPLPNGTKSFKTHYMLGFYQWDGYVHDLLTWDETYWDDLDTQSNFALFRDSSISVPYAEPEGHANQNNYQIHGTQNAKKARLSFMSELINAINSYSGGSAANQFNAEFVSNAGTNDETTDAYDFIYLECRTATAAGGAITADITCSSVTGASFVGGINLLTDVHRYGPGGYPGGGGVPEDAVLSDLEVRDSDGGSMVLEGNTQTTTGNAGAQAQIVDLTIYGNPSSGQTLEVIINGFYSMGSATLGPYTANYATNEAFANAISSDIHALSDYSTAVSEVTGTSHLYAPYKIRITGGTTTTEGLFQVGVYWHDSQSTLLGDFNDGAIGVEDEQLTLLSKSNVTLGTLNGIAIKATDYNVYSTQGQSWHDRYSNIKSSDLISQDTSKYLSWVYTPTQNNDPLFFDEGSTLRISESNFTLLADLSTLYSDNNITENINGDLATREPNPAQWFAYKDISKHFNGYFNYYTRSKGYFTGRLAKTWRFSMNEDEASFINNRTGVSRNLDNDLQGTSSTDITAPNDAALFFFMEKGTSGGLDWTGNIKVYLVACYDDGSESLPGHYFNTFAGTTSANYFGDVGGGSTLKMEVIFKPQSVSGLKCFDDERINGARLYYTHSEEGHSTFWNLGKLDFERGFIKAATVDTIDDTIGNEAKYTWNSARELPESGGTAYNTSMVDGTLTVYDKEANTFTIEYTEMPKALAYEDINGHSPQATTLNVGYKAICVAGMRTFVGNIRVWNGTSYDYYNDRMVVSPVNSLDSLPYPDNFLDLDISDGDEIIALAAFEDKVIQFKKRICYILNISTGIAAEFYIEERHKWKGILNKNHHCITDKGVFWLNERGAWIYNGEEIRDLFVLEDEEKSQQKIDRSEWESFISEDALVGYNAISREIIIVKNHTHASSDDADCYVFSLIVNSWTKGKRRFFSAANKSMTNIVNMGATGKLSYFIEEAPGGLASTSEVR